MQLHKIFGTVGVLLFVVVSSHGQSLGDVARQQREMTAKNGRAVHKVVTNEEIPESPEFASIGSTGSNEHTAAAPATNDTHSGEEWKAKIQAQKNSVASLQNQIDKLNSSIHFVEANRYTNGVQYNQRQAQKQDDVQRMQKQLDEQKQRLQDMQEAARKAGLGSSVYDP